jgi:hypothetical protein
MEQAIREASIEAKELLPHFIKAKIDKPTPLKPVPKRSYRKLTEHEKMLMVALRFGSLTDFSKKLNSWAQIGKTVGVTGVTATRIVTQFVKEGKFIDKRTVRKSEFPNAVIQEIIQPNVLKQWASYSC